MGTHGLRRDAAYLAIGINTHDQSRLRIHVIANLFMDLLPKVLEFLHSGMGIGSMSNSNREPG